MIFKHEYHSKNKEIELTSKDNLSTTRSNNKNNLSATSILKKALNVNTNSRMIFENSKNNTKQSARDNDYISAVESGDTKTAQEMVEQSAENGQLVIINKNKANNMLAPIGVQPSEREDIINLAKSSLSQDSENVKNGEKNSLRDNDYIKAVENGDTDKAQEQTQKIQVGMSDSERTAILKNKMLTVAHYDGQADKIIKQNDTALESKKTGIVKKALKKVVEYFGNFGNYNIKDFDIEVSYSNNTVKESASKITDKKALAKLFPVIDEAIENAVGISSENNRYYYDDRTNYYHTLLSGYIDENYFVPIRLGVKENTDGKNKLYVVIGQNKIDLRVLKLPASKLGQSNSRLRSTISIAEICKNVNSKDLLRYLPDDMISESGRKTKYEGIAETIKYTNDKNDKKYAEYVRKGDLANAKKMVEAKAKAVGFDIKAYHGTAVDLSLKPKKYGDAPFYVFNAGNDDLIHFGTEEQAFTMGRKKYERKNELAYWYTFECYLKINNPYQTYDRGLDWKETVEYANKNGYDGIIYENKYEGNGISYAVFNSNQIKSADAITYDDDGNVIPLSKRFDESDNDIRFSLRDTNNYSYDELTSKPDMKITTLSEVSDAEYEKYQQNTSLFAKDMVKIARKANNLKNTKTATYLHNDDTNSDIMIAKDSFKHGASRFDKSYVDVSKNLSSILKNAIAVNELKPRENSNGTKVFIGMTEYNDNYVFVRMVVDNRTQNLNDYDILYAIKKEDVSPRLPDYPASRGSVTSSTISISDLLENVKNVKLVNSVLSKDVCEKLGIYFVRLIFCNSEFLKQK